MEGVGWSHRDSGFYAVDSGFLGLDMKVLITLVSKTEDFGFQFAGSGFPKLNSGSGLLPGKMIFAPKIKLPWKKLSLY